MNKKNFDIRRLEKVFNNMVETMDESKKDIFKISEDSRKTYEELKMELEIVQAEVTRMIDSSDALEEETQRARRHLAKVSQEFDRHTERELKEAYEVANELLVRLSINRLEEKQLRERRDELERRIAALVETVERADQLAGQVTIVLNYLTSDLKDVGPALQSAQQRQELAMQIIQAQEEERKRLSREIHDGPAQSLANVTLRAGLIEQMGQQIGNAMIVDELSTLKELSREALREVRRIIYDLRPMALDDLGIVPTLKRYLKKTMDYHGGVEIHFQSIGEPKRFDSNCEASVFRIVQESVSNALKHAQARDIWVKVEWLRDTMNIVVKDNGIGFDQNERKDKSFGLIGMRERVDLLKGSMSIQSKVNEGTTIFFQLPTSL